MSNRLELGQLISDEVTVAMFDFYFQTVLDDKKHMLIDGYPRTLEQVVSLMKTSLAHKRQFIGIHLELDKATASERMLARGREDDKPAIIEKRINVFYEKTIPNIELFEKLFPVVSIDASGTVEEVHKQIMKAIDEN